MTFSICSHKSHIHPRSAGSPAFNQVNMLSMEAVLQKVTANQFYILVENGTLLLTAVIN